MLKSLIFAVLFCLVTGFSCSGGTPRDPHWHKEACAHCRMVLSEPRFAAQLIGPGSRVRYYDDIGCAMRHMAEDETLAEGTLYVRPEGGDAWVKAGEARFAAGFQTPMNSGFGAVTDGGTLSLDDLKRSLK